MKRIYYISIITLLLLMVQLPSAAAQSGNNATSLVASHFAPNELDLTDQVIDANWTEVEHYTNLIEFGDQGFIKFANNESHIFTLLHVDITKEWVAIEFNAYDQVCMANTGDGWTFYIDQAGAVTSHDEIYRGAAGPPVHDVDEDGGTDDLHIESVVDQGYVSIEVVREMNTTDVKDFQFANGTLTNLKFASSTHHATNIDDPSEFGPSEIFVLSVQTGGGEVIVPEVPATVDYDFYKFVIFVGVFVFAGVFMITHTLTRQVFRPLKHPVAVVDSSFERPTLKKRWKCLTKGHKEIWDVSKAEEQKPTGDETTA